MAADRGATSRMKAFGKPVRVRLSDVVSDPRFARRYVDHEFAEELFRHGMQNYPIVRMTDQGYMVVAGEKRLSALRFLATQVPSDYEYITVYRMVYTVSDEDASYLHSLSNCLVKDGASETDRLKMLAYYDSLSTTYMYRRWRSEEPWHFIAAMTGVPRATLMRAKTVQANVIPEARKLVDEGLVSLRMAAESVAKWSKENQAAFVSQVRDRRMSDPKEIQALARTFNPEPKMSLNKLTRDLKSLERAVKKGETTVDYRTAQKIYASAQKILEMSTETFNASRRKDKDA